MGAGWAILPIHNFILGAPLKVAAANSRIVLGTGACVAGWPYLRSGAMIPLFVAPLIAGQIFGGYLGSLLVLKIKAGFIRVFLIGILFFTSFGLIREGLERLNLIPETPDIVSVAVLVVILFFVFVSIYKSQKASEKISNRESLKDKEDV